MIKFPKQPSLLNLSKRAHIQLDQQNQSQKWNQPSTKILNYRKN